MLKALYTYCHSDPFCFGGLMGAALTLPYLGFDALFHFTLGTNLIPVYSAILVVTQTNAPTIPQMALGALADICAGAFLGALFSEFLRITTPLHSWLKGLGLGGVTWIIHVSMIPKLWEPRLLALMNVETVTENLFLHLAWGIAVGALNGYYFRQETSRVNGAKGELDDIVERNGAT